MNFKQRLIEAIEQSRAIAQENKDDFSQGRYDGLKQALELLESEG